MPRTNRPLPEFWYGGIAPAGHYFARGPKRSGPGSERGFTMTVQARNVRLSGGKMGAVVTIRAILATDVEACGRVAYEAHRTVAAEHNYPSEHPSAEFSIGLI